MQEFCVHCGSKNLYESSKPKFCCGCGNPFNKSISSRAEVEEDEFEEDSIQVIPSKASLAKDWFIEDNPWEHKRQTIGDFVRNPSKPEGYGPRDAPKSIANLKGDDLVRYSQQECAKVTKSREI